MNCTVCIHTIIFFCCLPTTSANISCMSSYANNLTGTSEPWLFTLRCCFNLVVCCFSSKKRLSKERMQTMSTAHNVQISETKIITHAHTQIHWLILFYGYVFTKEMTLTVSQTQKNCTACL